MSDIDRYQYGYDSDSNRLWKANSTTTGLDEFYTYDPLNRLTKMQRGVLNGTNTGITGTPAREMDYTLDQLGNWNPYVTKTSGSTDLNQTRTHNTVNEITAIGGTPAWATPPGYDDAGNMTSFPQPDDPTTTPYTAVYDAWNRLVQVSDGSNLVAQYQYDGQNWRTVKKTYAGSSILLSTRHYYYSSNWQDLEERVDTSTSANFQYVWGVRYIDELVCRDYANTPGSSSSSSSSGSPMPSSPSRLYAFQDANFNLTGVCDAGGTVRERYAYDPYGNRMVYDASWSPLATSDYAWVIGHQGLMIDIETGLVYNRMRLVNPPLGRFIQREPSGVEYVDSLNLYLYELDNPVDEVDPQGRFTPPRRLPCWPHCRWIPTPPPWNVPPGPACNIYGCSTCPPLKLICNNAGASPWANCVRGCLLANWNPAACSYKTNIAIIHADCWNTCANAFGHIGPP